METSVLELPELMRQKEYYFVLSESLVAGYIHFSDLNNSLVKLPYFILLEAIERHVWQAISSRLNEEDFPKVLSDDIRVQQLKQMHAKAAEEKTDMGWEGMLPFSEMLTFAVYYGVSRLTKNNIQLLSEVRNRVAHTDRPLVQTHSDMHKLVKIRELCQKLLQFKSGDIRNSLR